MAAAYGRSMTKERWRQIEAVFEEAVELPPEESRAYLDQVCGSDEELRREVDLLLESDRQAQGQIGSAVGQAAASFAVQMQRDYTASQIGQRIGPYEIVREIGRGGMGSVYQAVRIDDQYIRSVAIKFIAQGMDSEDALARFRTERQILATLQHPNIAGLLDGGTTTDGRPYIVMEYIEGEPILDYCRKRNLSVNERLTLFCALCSAVHHAHQMLVIHRDIKPANVLVTAAGIPKLLDFGIAKLLTPELTPDGDSTTKTLLRRLTPQYASPEQVRGEPLTTATDIYSLGVLLYELLTFTSPYRITGQTPQEIEKLVCESEPARLSIASKDVKWRRQLAGDLENIVAMALRKEPQRRYASVQQFADDVQRFTQGMPVSAREDTIFYLAGKLVRRNLLASAAFALLALSIVGGWFATYREAKRTEARFMEVRKLANFVLSDFQKSIQHLPGVTPARELLVRTALEYLNNLSKDAPSNDPTFQWELSQAYEQVGDVQGDLSGPNLGQFREALVSYNKALGLVEPLAHQSQSYDTLSCAAWLYYKRGDLEIRTVNIASAIRSYTEGLKFAERIDNTLHDSRTDDLFVNGYLRLANARSRLAEVKPALEDANRAAEAADRAALYRKDGGTANLARTRLLVGNLLWLRGDLQGAWTRYREAVAWLEKLTELEPDDTTHLKELEEAYRRCGDLQGNPAFFHFGDIEKALLYHRKALRIAEQLAARDPNDAMARAELSVALRRMAAVLRGAEPAQAIELYREALIILQELIRRSPGDLSYQRDLANTHMGLASALRNNGKLKTALEELNEALKLQKEMLERNPERAVVQEDMFEATLTLGELKLAMRDSASAFESLMAALKRAQSLSNDRTDSLYSERCLALVYQRLGDYYAYRAGRSTGQSRAAHISIAHSWYDKALDIWSRWRSQNLAVPFSTNREREILRVKSAFTPPISTL